MGRFWAAKNTSAVELATIVAKDVLKNAGLGANEVQELILGQILQAGLGQNPARQVALKSGMREESGAYTINKLCGSGLKAIALGAQSIALGEQEVILAGGAENMSLSPFLLDNIRGGYKMGNQSVVDSMLKDALTCAMNNYHMGITAENLAKNITFRAKNKTRLRCSRNKKPRARLKQASLKTRLPRDSQKQKR